MRRAILTLALGLAALAALIPAPEAGSAGVGYRVIVHPDNDVPAVRRRFVADAFLKKVVEWPDGQNIRPVDLSAHLPTRRLFVEDALNRSLGAVKRYWQQMIFSGRSLPPPELDSDEAVVRYVLRHKGAIGYVSTSADTSGAKIVTLE